MATKYEVTAEMIKAAKDELKTCTGDEVFLTDFTVKQMIEAARWARP